MIAKSLICVVGNQTEITFKVTRDKDITGIWQKDYEKFTCHLGETQSRLIMAFGPSASGKTFCAQELIKLMRKVDESFPTCFFAIDGGIYRDESYIYNAIAFTANKYGIIGINNLVNPDAIKSFLGEGSLFDASSVKKSIVRWLDNNQNDTRTMPSLYVPVTATDCVLRRSPHCIKEWEQYLKMTGDEKWICSMIYQHKTANACTWANREEYKCIGCLESGTRREKKGKKYSDSGWEYSYIAGNRALAYKGKNPPKYKLRIHNPGAENRQFVLEDFSEYNAGDKTVHDINDDKWHCVEGEYVLALNTIETLEDRKIESHKFK